MSSTSRWKALAALAIIAVGVIAYFVLRGGSEREQVTGDKEVWRYSVWGPPRAFTKGIEKAKEMWEAAGNGRFELQVAYASALSPEKENLDSIKIGLIESAHVCVGYHPAKLPLAQVLELPFLLPNDTLAAGRVIDAVLRHPLVEAELAERWNAKYLMVSALTPYEFMGNRRVATVDDLKGLRMRISGANATILDHFGAVATMVTAPETYTALERGTIDLVGFPWTDSFGVFRLHEVSKYAIVGISMSGFACFSAVSLDAWNRMPPDLQAMLEDVREQSMLAKLEAYEESDKKWLPIFRERLEIVEFPKSERAKMVAAAEPLWNEWAADLDRQGMAGSEILKFAKEQVAKYAGAR